MFYMIALYLALFAALELKNLFKEHNFKEPLILTLFLSAATMYGVDITYNLQVMPDVKVLYKAVLPLALKFEIFFNLTI